MSARIASAKTLPYRLPLRRPWRFAERALNERSGWLIRLVDERGRIGWGESAPLPAIGTEQPAVTARWLSTSVPRLVGTTPDTALTQLAPAAAAPPAARCGLETALLDLSAQQIGRPLRCLLRPDAASRVTVSGVLGAMPQWRADPLRQVMNQGYRCLKLKVGVYSPKAEARALGALFDILPARIEIRLDANRAWRRAQAESFLSRAPIDARLQWIEEPLADGPAQIAALREKWPIAVALDESLNPGSLDQVVESAAVDVLVLKPMRLGGLLPCLDLARRAAAAGIRCLVTTSLDGAVGRWAAAQLAAAVDAKGAAMAHGLATGDWLARDFAPGPEIRAGEMALPDTPGLGCAAENCDDRF